MISDDTRKSIESLPWRGPVVPIDTDGPDSKLPVRGEYYRVRVFNLMEDDDQRDYETILNRIGKGLAEEKQSSLTTLADGSFRLLLVWAEAYMSSPDYRPAEALPEIVSCSRASVVLTKNAAPEDHDVAAQVAAWMGEEKKRKEARKQEEPVAEALPEDRGPALCYEEEPTYGVVEPDK